MSNLMEDAIASEFLTVDASEIPFPTTEHGAETLASNGISTTVPSTGEFNYRISGCHQQYHPISECMAFLFFFAS